jgi:hypothetical protein
MSAAGGSAAVAFTCAGPLGRLVLPRERNRPEVPERLAQASRERPVAVQQFAETGAASEVCRTRAMHSSALLG